MTDFLWELHQGADIEQAKTQAQWSARDAAEAMHFAENVRMRLDKLTLVSMAVWSLVKEKTSLTDEDLMERVRQIDLSDGVLDGQVKLAPVKCASCGRTMSRRHSRCMYCGSERLNADAFETTR